MGKTNVPGRLTKCGHGVNMYTYPAWSFGGKHSNQDATPGPGPGQFVLPSTFNTVGPGFGPAPKPSTAPAHGPRTLGDLPQPDRGPSHSFGLRLAARGDDVPGPLSYQVPAWPNNHQAAATWGPPTRQRPFTAPRPITVLQPTIKSTKGPSFGLPYKPLKDAGTPGPNAYGPVCAGCCIACDSYKGRTFGLRPPSFYEQKAFSPGPANYHTECSTIGAATQNCASGSSAFRAKRSV